MFKVESFIDAKEIASMIKTYEKNIKLFQKNNNKWSESLTSSTLEEIKNLTADGPCWVFLNDSFQSEQEALAYLERPAVKKIKREFRVVAY